MSVLRSLVLCYQRYSLPILARSGYRHIAAGRATAGPVSARLLLGGATTFGAVGLMATRGLRAAAATNDVSNGLSPNEAAPPAATASMPDSPTPPPKQPVFPFTIPSWLRWFFGSVLAVVLSFWTKQVQKVRQIEEAVEEAVEAAEAMVEVVEKVAAATEKLTAGIAEKLPEDSKLREAAELVEHVAEEVEHKAEIVEDIFDKANELKEEVEELFHPDSDTKQGKSEDGH